MSLHYTRTLASVVFLWALALSLVTAKKHDCQSKTRIAEQRSLFVEELAEAGLYSPFSESIARLNKKLDCGRSFGKFNFALDFKVKNSYNCSTNQKRKHHGRKHKGDAADDESPRPRIAGGYAAQNAEFPSYARLIVTLFTEKRKYFCGGTLISDRVVVTSAKCINWTSGESEVEVQMGILEGRGPTVSIKAHIGCHHPKWKEGTGQTNFDVAFVVLDKPTAFNENVQPACLGATNSPKFDAQCVLVGMGVNHNQRVTGKMIGLPVKKTCAPSQCNDTHKGVACYISNWEEYKGNPCYGDDGGPIYCVDDCDGTPRHTVIGANSFGPGECTKEPKTYCAASFYNWGEDMEKFIETCKPKVFRTSGTSAVENE